MSLLHRILLFAFSLFVFPAEQFAKVPPKLQAELQKIIAQSKTRVGLAVYHSGTGESFSINNSYSYPMQSVYKFPLAMAVLNEVDKGRLKLDQQIYVDKKILVEDTWSPMRDAHPDGNFFLSLAELLDYTVSGSDNIGCDLLFGLINGPATANQYIKSLGHQEIHILDTEEKMHSDLKAQYRNWTRPVEMNKLLKNFMDGKYLSDTSRKFLMHLLINSRNSFGRIRGLLPEDLVVAHKTGTGSDNQGLSACNDVGIIFMPDGSKLVMSIFTTGGPDDFDAAQAIMARISKAIYDHYNKKQSVTFEKRILVSGVRRDTIPYRICAPANEDKTMKYPLLVYLHGSGSRGKDNEKPLKSLPLAFTDSFNRARYPCYILIPQCPEDSSWVNFPDFPAGLKTSDSMTHTAYLTLSLITYIARTRNIDPTRIYLTGYSLGGEGAFELAAREPKLFACVVPVAGIADTSKAYLFRNTPIWSFHGADDKVNSPLLDRTMMQLIMTHGGRPGYTEIPHVGHDCRKEAYSEPKLWYWMFSNQRKK